MRAPRFARANVFGSAISSAVVLLFCLILLGRDPLVFWNDDYQISISPVLADIARSWRDGNWPLLSPHSWVCGNLAGEFQYGTFSIFINAAVVAIWNLFNRFAHQAAALSTLHLIVLATGGFLLGRGRGFSPPLAVFVSLVAALNGWIICWGASDWFGALGAFAWLPWAWWGLEKALATDVALGAGQSSNQSHRRAADVTTPWRFLWPAPFVYLVVTGGFPYTVGMLGVLIGWLTIKTVVVRKNVFSILPMLAGAALGCGMGIPAVLALLDYVQGSAREIQPASAHWQWIVPPAALPGLILPAWTVNWADFGTHCVSHAGTELACGVVAPAAFLGGLMFKRRTVISRLGWELLLLATVLMIAMLPSAGVFRWSFRWLPFFHLILVLCAAECLALLGGESDGKRYLRWVALLAFVLTAAVAIGMISLHTDGKYAFPLTTILLIITVLWIALDYALMEGRATLTGSGQALASPVQTVEYEASQELRPPLLALRAWLPAGATFASLLATYLCIPPNCGVPRYNFTETLNEPAPLDPSRLYLSVYPMPEVRYRAEANPQPLGQIIRPGSTSMWGQLRFINGYSPIRPSGVAREFKCSIHGEIDTDIGRSLVSNEGGPDRLLAQIGVDGVIIASDFDFNPQPAGEWQLVSLTSEGRVFHRAGPPLARVRSFQSLPSRSGRRFVTANVSTIREERNRVEADIDVPAGDTPALIAFSRPYFRGYQARLGNTTLTVDSERGLFPVIELPGGSRGHLELVYRPAWLIYGGAVAIVCAVLWIVFLIMAVSRRT